LKLRSPSLFWRTFLLVLGLMVASMAAWLQSLRALEIEPRVRQVAAQVVSAANITRSALLYADPAARGELLRALAANEGIRIYPLESSDAVAPLRDSPFARRVETAVRANLGAATRMADEVNGIRGIWVSLDIDGDAYWLYLARDPLTRDFGTGWLGWAAAALLLSVLGAVLITRLVNQPLARLTTAVRELGAGRHPAPLPEAGPIEIESVNRSFNRMVDDLDKLAADREVLLAGISHDLRTPLTRLRLELELAPLDEATRAAMAGDIEQMDAIVRQFLDYARSRPGATAPLDLGELVAHAVAATRIESAPRSSVRLALAPDVQVVGNATELSRAVENLVVNAHRYGRDAAGELHLDVALGATDAEAVLSVSDRGAGIAAGELDRVLRPFERGEAARSGHTGAGLGLPIVARIAQRHGGSLALAHASGGGLCAVLRLPRAPTAAR
jgi:two-component system osmolarity sensor histidine kinase EnvZ